MVAVYFFDGEAAVAAASRLIGGGAENCFWPDAPAAIGEATPDGEADGFGSGLRMLETALAAGGVAAGRTVAVGAGGAAF